MASYGAAWRSMVRHCVMTQHGVPWRSMAQHCISWRSLAQHGKALRDGTAWCSMAQHSAAWCKLVQHGKALLSKPKQSMAQHSTAIASTTVNKIMLKVEMSIKRQTLKLIQPNHNYISKKVCNICQQQHNVEKRFPIKNQFQIVFEMALKLLICRCL